MLKENPEINLVLKKARDWAQAQQHQYVTVEHLLFSLCCYRNFKQLLLGSGVDVTQLTTDLRDHLLKQHVHLRASGSDEVNPQRTVALERVFHTAVAQALNNNQQQLQLINLVAGICAESNSHAAYLLLKHGVDLPQLEQFFQQHYQAASMHSDLSDTAPNSQKSKSSMTESEALQVLTQYCQNLNHAAAQGQIDPVIGRDAELAQITRVLAKRNRRNVLLVGEAGVGKTALAEGLALRIQQGQVPAYLRDWTVWSLEVSALLSGSRFRGDFEEKLSQLIAALQTQGNCILFVDEAHQMRGAGTNNHQGVDFVNMLKPALARGRIKVIASTTWQEYTQTFERDQALMRRFHRLSVTEPTPEQAEQMLLASRVHLEQHHGGSITDAAVRDAVQLSVRHQPDRRLPDKALDLLDAACARHKAADATDWQVDQQHVQLEISQITGIPVEQLTAQQQPQLADLETRLRQRLFGQDPVLDQVLDRLFISQAGLAEPHRPIGNFLFTGPTGTGKTQLAQLVAEHMHMHLLRYDMTEYQEPHSIARLIGAPPGYVGHSESRTGSGLLITDLEQHPRSVLLFDEADKADPAVLQVLLQMMDSGTVTGSTGKTADCRNCVIILTSNLGAAAAELNTPGFHNASNRAQQRAVRAFFPPEFRNRLDAVCEFQTLDQLSLRKIVAKFLCELNQQLQHRNIRVTATEALVDEIIAQAATEQMGARPIARCISRLIRQPLSRRLLFDPVQPGQQLILDWRENQLHLEAQHATCFAESLVS